MAIKIIRSVPHTKEWYDFRRNGIGGSEIGVVLGSKFNEYGSAIKLFYEKIGEIQPNTEPTEVARHGQLLEEYIVDNWWRYYDGTIEGTMKNQDANNVVRTCQRVNGYYQNDKYPWLFASVDRLIHKGQRRLVDDNGHISFGDVNDVNGILECKTANTFVARKYDGGIPPYQIVQVQDYMTILELEYSEFAILEDLRKFYCVPMERRQGICDMIIEKTFDFWHNHVLPAKELRKEYVHVSMQGRKNEAEKIKDRIMQYEPEADSNDQTREFISSRFNQEQESIPGDVSLFNKCVEYKRLTAMIKTLIDRKDSVYNNLMNVCVQNKCGRVELPNGGYYKMFRREGSVNHQLTFGKIKDERIDKAELDAERI